MPLKTAATVPPATVTSRAEGRFYIGMALVAAATALAGFGPALVDPASRLEPLTWAVGLHGVVFSAWLVLFLAQTLLISNGRIAVHRRLGYAGAILAVLMVVSGYFTTIEMVRRGHDLSGDLIGDNGDPMMLMVFQLGDLAVFGVLVAAAVLFRRRSDVHKRLMLLATVGGLMPAALSHIIGHSTFLRGLHPAIILIPYIAFLFAGAVHDRLSRGRIHAVSLWVALAVFVFSNLRAMAIGPSDAWREFATWLTR
jgi:uncharacterized membrane protein YozB (DUF420 family)